MDGWTGRTVLLEDESFRLVLNPAEGRILFRTTASARRSLRENKQGTTGTNFLPKEIFHAAMQSLTAKLGIPASEIERKQDGSFSIGSDIFINWPSLSTNAFVSSPRPIAELKATLKSGKALWDYKNELGADAVKSISVTGIRVV